MTLRPPTLAEMRETAERHGFHHEDADLRSFHALTQEMLRSYDYIDELVEPSLPVKYPRTPGRRPAPEENVLGGWYWKCDLPGAADGPLAGRSIVVKDTVCVAGIPMMNGCRALEGFVPDVDATVVTRVLDAGGTIVGKATCENLCCSAESYTAATGPVHNPHNPDYSTGGSSSGCAALVASGEVDMAIGGDQNGSVRIPSAWSGIYGLKPTWGLVPYTGVFQTETTLDHVGPMATSAADLALLLDVIAGPDGLDSRQGLGLRVDDYTSALTEDIEDLRVGLVVEGFGWESSEPDVDELVREAAQSLSRLGCVVRDVSIPSHRHGHHLAVAILMEGGLRTIFTGNGMGTSWRGHYVTSLIESFARGRLANPDDLAEGAKLLCYVGEHMQRVYHGRYYAKAQNLARALLADYDAALAAHDLLIMPTLPMKATRLPSAASPEEEYTGLAFEMGANTSPFNVTGHPAISVPVGQSCGLPVGMMLVAPRWEDSRLLRAAHAYQNHLVDASEPSYVASHGMADRGRDQ